MSHWHQIDEIHGLQPTTVLEIGIGSGLVSEFLRWRGFSIVTLDIDIRLHPRITGSILALPFHDSAFELVTCFQVIEHLPYSAFQLILSGIRSVAAKYALISLPDNSRNKKLLIDISFVGTFRAMAHLIPWFKAPNIDFDGQHYWGIGSLGYPLERIVSDVGASGF